MDMAMSMLSIQLEATGLGAFQEYLIGLGTRMTREQLQPILFEHFGPVVAEEKAILGPHSKSGALEMSLSARAEGGVADFPGTISVFSVPTASKAAIIDKWAGSGRLQQRKWALREALRAGSGRRRIFYGNILASGHRAVRRVAGELKVVGQVDPVPYARGAMETVGEGQVEKAAMAILNHIGGA
jgi:hypothetical protein